MNTTDKNNGKSRNGTRLNKAFRNGLGINSRRRKCGCPVENCAYLDKDDNEIVKFLDQDTENGGNVTPFNIQCNCDGACAIRKIIFNGDETIVLFSDGDRVQLRRHDKDANDPVTAVLWALGEKVFGTELARQINRALKYRASTIEELRKEKRDAKSESEKEKLVPVNG